MQRNEPSRERRPRIVILGGGFAGAYCAQRLERKLRADEAEVLLIDRNDYFVYDPLLVEAGTGSLEPRHTVVPLRRFVRSAGFRMAEALAVDALKHTVTCQVTEDDAVDVVEYDHLVISVGSVTQLPEIPGLRKYGFRMKSLADAVGLRDRAIRMLERADAVTDETVRRALLHFVVVGGNFTGVEVAGEFHAFLRNAARVYRNVEPQECNVTLIERSDGILRALDDPDLSAFAMRHLRRRGVSLRLETSVERIEADRLVLNSGETVSARTVVWCAGISPNPLLRNLGLPTDERGYLVCEPDLRVKGTRDVWAIGDCAVNVGRGGRTLPATAQTAVRTGAHLARNIICALRGRKTTPPDVAPLGTLVALGYRSSVAKILGIKIWGFPAWFLWRTVYLMKMPGWTRRFRIALDWTINLFFGCDYVELGLYHERK